MGKMRVIELDIQDFWKETQHKVEKSKKAYSRKTKHKKKKFNEDYEDYG